MPDWKDLKEELDNLEGGDVAISKRTTDLESIKNLIANHHITEDTLPQIQPMLATDSGMNIINELDQYDNNNYSIEPKFNGIRMLCFIKDGEIRFQTRGRSVKTQLFTERTGHYPHYIPSEPYPKDLEDTILDGEMIAYTNSPRRKKNLWVDNDLSLMMSFNGGSDEAGVLTQKERGQARYIIFDIIKCGGEDMRFVPQMSRRKKLVDAITRINDACVNLNFDISPEWIPGNKYSISERFDAVTKTGGEGLILKDRSSRYENRRTKTWIKVKRFEEAIGYVSEIYKMGSNSIEGMAGSIVIVDADGKYLARVGGIARDIRADLVIGDGIINPKYVGKKVLIRWHVTDKHTGNPHHARLISWLNNNDNEQEIHKEEVK